MLIGLGHPPHHAGNWKYVDWVQRIVSRVLVFVWPVPLEVVNHRRHLRSMV